MRMFVCGVALVFSVTAAAKTPLPPLTATAAVQTTRFVHLSSEPPATELERAVNPDKVISISPNGRRYVVRTVRGDVASDRVLIDFWSASLSSLASAASPVKVATISSTGRSRGVEFAAAWDTVGTNIGWIGDRSIAVNRFNEALGHDQLISIDLDTGKIQALVENEPHVMQFHVLPDRSVLYMQRDKHTDRSAELAAAGYVLPGKFNIFDIVNGRLDSASAAKADYTRWTLQRPDATAQVLKFDGSEINQSILGVFSPSPSGKIAVLNVTSREYPQSWDRYEEHLTKTRLKMIRDDMAAGREPDSYGVIAVHTPYIVDLQTGATRRLMNAPADCCTRRIAWSPDESQFVMTGVALPDVESEASRMLEAAAVFDAASDRYEVLPIRVALHEVRELVWRSDGSITFDVKRGNDITKHRFIRAEGVWQERPASDQATNADNRFPVAMRLIEGLDRVPQLYAVDRRTGAKKLALNPNPDLLERHALGNAEVITGALPTGEQWQAAIHYPPRFQRGRRYPVVLQSIYARDIPRDKFHLYVQSNGSSALGPNDHGGYPGRVFGSRGIVAVTVNLNQELGHAAEGLRRKQTFEEVAKVLVERGIADRSRIGLLGFSRNGYYVEYTLAHTEFPFAAAVALDNVNFGYFQYTLTGSSGFFDQYGTHAPYGEGLQEWFKEAPSFNAHKIDTPLLLIGMSDLKASGLASLETFQRMRHARKPVEMWFMPDAMHFGGHNPQNPRQVMAVLEKNLDWFDYWLNGNRQDVHEKREQYVRWDEMRTLNHSSITN